MSGMGMNPENAGASSSDDSMQGVVTSVEFTGERMRQLLQFNFGGRPNNITFTSGEKQVEGKTMMDVAYVNKEGNAQLVTASVVTEEGKKKYVVEETLSDPKSLNAIINTAQNNNAYVEISQFIIPYTDVTIKLQIGSKEGNNRDLRVLYNEREIFLREEIRADGERRYIIDNRQEYIDQEIVNLLCLVNYMEVDFAVFRNTEVKVGMNQDTTMLEYVIEGTYRDIETLKRDLNLLALRDAQIIFNVEIPTISETMTQVIFTQGRKDYISVVFGDQRIDIETQEIKGVERYVIDMNQQHILSDINPDNIQDAMLLAHYMNAGGVVFQNFTELGDEEDVQSQDSDLDSDVDIENTLTHVYRMVRELPEESSVKFIGVEESKMTPEIFQDLVQVLKPSTGIKSFYFNDNKRRTNGYLQIDLGILNAYLYLNNKIEGLSLLGNYDIGNDALLNLFNILSQKTTLRTLGISGNGEIVTDEVVDALIGVISQNPLHKLTIYDIGFDSRQIERIMKAINAKPTLQDLSLEYLGRIGIEGCKIVFREIGCNRTLREISFKNDDEFIAANSAEYHKAFAECFMQNRGLDSIDISLNQGNQDVSSALKRSLNTDEISEDDLVTSIEGKRRLLETGRLTLTDKNVILTKQDNALANLFVTLGVVKKSVNPDPDIEQNATHISALPDTVIHLIAQYVFTEFGDKMAPSQGRSR